MRVGEVRAVTALPRLLVTCEHGGNRVPVRYRRLFATLKRVLDSHRGLDLGALTVARDLARAFHAPLVPATVTRLLVDLNRSVGHPQLFSEATRNLQAHERARILQTYYLPYRTKVEQTLESMISRGGSMIHISSHSFTPVLGDQVRSAEIGLLYDPSRKREAELAARWRRALVGMARTWRVRRNYPYRGYNDGLTSHLRRRFPARDYIGLEIEVNQALVAQGGAEWRGARAMLTGSLREALRDL